MLAPHSRDMLLQGRKMNMTVEIIGSVVQDNNVLVCVKESKFATLNWKFKAGFSTSLDNATLQPRPQNPKYASEKHTATLCMHVAMEIDETVNSRWCSKFPSLALFLGLIITLAKNVYTKSPGPDPWTLYWKPSHHTWPTNIIFSVSMLEVRWKTRTTSLFSLLSTLHSGHLLASRKWGTTKTFVAWPKRWNR